MVRQSLQGGYCYYPENVCAFEKNECLDTDKFASSREMQDAPGAHGGICLKQSKILSTLLGKCEDNTCSPNAASCPNPGSYVESPANDDSCLIENTTFGSCGNRCSWSPESCLAGETWTFPAQDCSCDQVQVGGCMKDDEFYCAVSPKGCDEFSAWMSPLDTVDASGKTCFLCRENMPPEDGDPSSSGDGDSGSTGNNGPTNSSSNGNNKSPRDETPLVIGATVGIIVCIAAVAFAALYQRRHTRAVRAKKMEKAPAEAIPKTDAGDDISIL